MFRRFIALESVISILEGLGMVMTTVAVAVTHLPRGPVALDPPLAFSLVDPGKQDDKLLLIPYHVSSQQRNFLPSRSQWRPSICCKNRKNDCCVVVTGMMICFGCLLGQIKLATSLWVMGLWSWSSVTLCHAPCSRPPARAVILAIFETLTATLIEDNH